MAISLQRLVTFAHLCVYVINIFFFVSCYYRICPSNLLLVCFLSIVGLEKLLDWGGEHLRRFIKDRDDELGDLIAFTLNKYIQLVSE